MYGFTFKSITCILDVILPNKHLHNSITFIYIYIYIYSINLFIKCKDKKFIQNPQDFITWAKRVNLNFFPINMRLLCVFEFIISNMFSLILVPTEFYHKEITEIYWKDSTSIILTNPYKNYKITFNLNFLRYFLSLFFLCFN